MSAHFFPTGAVELFYRFRRWTGRTAPQTPPPETFNGDYGEGGDFDQTQLPTSTNPNAGVPGDGGTGLGGRSAGPWYYLGTAVESPEIEATVVTSPVDCDLAPSFQRLFQTEVHQVTAVLNRLNFRAWNFLKGKFIGDGEDTVRAFTAGNLVLNSEDCELFIRYALPHAGVQVPDAAARGRLYFSADLAAYHESSRHSRVQEVAVAFDCSPLYFVADKRHWLYSERESDLPVVVPE